jgi:hypothetical protein
MTDLHGLPLTEVTSEAAAEELLRRLQAATRSVTDLGGYPPADLAQRVVVAWLAEFGLNIEDEPDPAPGEVLARRTAFRGAGGSAVDDDG